jgi:tRNA threonylcarbamoyladenosine biosynthesis protein TsaB
LLLGATARTLAADPVYGRGADARPMAAQNPG